MSQHDYQIDDGNGLTVLNDLNAALQAIVTNNAGASAPPTTFANMLWIDTTNKVVMRRDSGNANWMIHASAASALSQSKSGAYTAAKSDHAVFMRFTGAGVFTLALTAAATLGDGWWVPFKNDSTGAITIDPNGSEQVDSQTTISIAAGQSGFLYCTGAAFYTVGLTAQASSATGTYRNRLINGTMQVDQRNVAGAQTFTAAAALAYCVDRWYGWATGANITGQQITLANGQKRYRFTGATSNTGGGFAQRIEAVNSLDLAGTTANLQVKLASSSLTTVNWAAYYASTSDAFGTLVSPTRTLISNGSFTISSTEATYSTNIAVPSGATTGIEVVFTFGALVASQTLQIGDVQFEPGTSATAVERPKLGQVLAECQRYYWKSFPQATVPAQNAGLAGAIATTATGVPGALYGAKVVFPTVMRATPTLTSYSPSAASSNWYNRTVPQASGAFTGQDITDSGFLAQGGQVSGDANGSLCSVHVVAVAEL